MDEQINLSTELYNIKVNITTGWAQEDRRKARISVSGEAEVDTSTLPHTIRGEQPDIDKAWDRANRQIVKNQRALLEDAIRTTPELARVLGGMHLYFGRKAGCSCGCSPAFIADTHIRASEFGKAGNVTWIFISPKVA